MVMHQSAGGRGVMCDGSTQYELIAFDLDVQQLRDPVDGYKRVGAQDSHAHRKKQLGSPAEWEVIERDRFQGLVDGFGAP